MITEKQAEVFISAVIDRQVSLMSKSVTVGLTAAEITKWHEMSNFLRESRYMTLAEIEKFM